MVKSSTFVTFVTSYKAVCHLCPFYKAHLSLPNRRGGCKSASTHNSPIIIKAQQFSPKSTDLHQTSPNIS